MDGDIVEDAITYAKLALGVERLKEKQEEAIKTFVKGRDCFVILPTGYGKTLCYVLLPYVFDRLRKKERTCIVLCVSPLVSLMMDQVSKYSALGLLTQKLFIKFHSFIDSYEAGFTYVYLIQTFY